MFTQSTQKKSNSELLWSAMEVIPFWPSQHQQLSKVALHRTPTISSQFPGWFCVPVRFGSIRFTVPGRYGSCRFVFYGSVRFAGTLYNGVSYGFERCSHPQLHSLSTVLPHNDAWKNRQKSGVVHLFQHDNSVKRPQSDTSPKTNMASRKTPIFNRKCIFIGGGLFHLPCEFSGSVKGSHHLVSFRTI